MSGLSEELETAVQNYKRVSDRIKKEGEKAIEKLLKDKRSYDRDTEELRKKLEKIVDDFKNGGIK